MKRPPEQREESASAGQPAPPESGDRTDVTEFSSVTAPAFSGSALEIVDEDLARLGG